MTALLPAHRRAEKFAALVDASSTSADGERDARLVELVGSLRSLADQAPAPRADYVTDLRARLMAEADTVLVATDRKLVLPERRTPATGRRLQSRFAAATAGVVLVGASAGVAVAAQGSLPGETLYPVKRGIEQVHEALSFSDAGRGRDLLNQAGARLDEADALLARGDQDGVSDSLHSFMQSAGHGSDLLFTQYQNNGDDSSINTVRDFAGTSMGQLTALAATAPAALRPDFADAAQLLADIDQQASVLCGSCGAREPLSVPTQLELASATSSLNTLLETGPIGDAAKPTRPAASPSAGASSGAGAPQPSATDTSGIVMPDLGDLLGGDRATTSAPGGAPPSQQDPLGGLLKLPSPSAGASGIPGAGDLTKKVKGTVDGITGSVLGGH